MGKENTSSRRITAHYALAFAVFFGCYCMIRSFISVYLLDRGFSYTQVGVITGIHMLCTALIQPNFSQILDRFPKLGLHRFMTILCVPAILCSLLTFIVPANLFFYILIFIIFGFCEVGMQSLMVSVGMEYVNAGIPVDPGIGRGFGSVGYAIANVLLGRLIVRFGSQISQTLNVILMILLAILLYTLPDPRIPEQNSESNFQKPDSKSDSLSAFLHSNRVYARFTFSVIFIFFGHCIVNTYLPDISAQFGLKSDFTGAVIGMAAGLELIPMMFYTRISKKISPLKLLTISAVFFTVKIFATTMARNAAGIVLAQAMQILAYAFFSMSSIYFTNEAVPPRDRVMAQGLMVGANEAGFTIGSLVGGIVLDHTLIRVLLWIGVAVSAIGSVLMLSAIRQFRRSSR